MLNKDIFDNQLDSYNNIKLQTDRTWTSTPCDEYSYASAREKLSTNSCKGKKHNTEISNNYQW